MFGDMYQVWMIRSWFSLVSHYSAHHEPIHIEPPNSDHSSETSSYFFQHQIQIWECLLLNLSKSYYTLRFVLRFCLLPETSPENLTFFAFSFFMVFKSIWTFCTQILYMCLYIQYSVQFSHSVMSDSLRPRELQHTRSPCPSPTPRVHPNPCPLSRGCHPTISSSVVPFSSCPQSFPASGSFQMSQLFASGGQSIGVSDSASVLPMNSQVWSPLGWTGWMSLQSKGLSRVFSNTTV